MRRYLSTIRNANHHRLWERVEAYVTVQRKTLCKLSSALRRELRMVSARLRHKRHTIRGCIRQPGYHVKKPVQRSVTPWSSVGTWWLATATRNLKEGPAMGRRVVVVALGLLASIVPAPTSTAALCKISVKI